MEGWERRKGRDGRERNESEWEEEERGGGLPREGLSERK